eukprot:3862669-Pyramimonas_sp.AAC.1
MATRQKAADRSWQAWVETAFDKGARAARRASKTKVMKAAVTHTDDPQPYQFTDREIDCLSEVWSCHDGPRGGLPSDHGSWEDLPKLSPDDLMVAAFTLPWRTAVGPTRLHPRAF